MDHPNALRSASTRLRGRSRLILEALEMLLDLADRLRPSKAVDFEIVLSWKRRTIDMVSGPLMPSSSSGGLAPSLLSDCCTHRMPWVMWSSC